jgi:transcriptional regulator GlxA family with amidase domain
VQAPALLDAIMYIKHTYPRLQCIISVRTGASSLARARVLNDRRATTNKPDWMEVAAQRPDVTWVPVVRWVVDGNLWTISGVAVGMDRIFGFLEHIYRDHLLTQITNSLGNERHADAS